MPLEVIPEGYATVSKRIQALGGTPTLRMASKKAGPVITDNGACIRSFAATCARRGRRRACAGNFVIDADFGQVTDAAALHSSLINIPGIVETGIFPNMAVKAYFGQADGSVSVRTK